MQQNPIEKLKNYFQNREDVVMAFLFGSRAKKTSGKLSDWDIAVYFKTDSGEIEWEKKEREYLEENKVWNDMMKILETDAVDLVVLNRVASSIAASAIAGVPLVIKDRRLYLEFMLRVTQEAEDYRQTVKEYSQVYWRSHSLSQEDRDILEKRLIFLDSELQDANRFKDMTQHEYEQDRSKRREVERWVENLMNATIDICKTALASERQSVPSTYREIVERVGIIPIFSQDTSSRLSQWASLRNVLAHEYLDIRWKQIDNFIHTCEKYFEDFTKSVRELMNKSD